MNYINISRYIIGTPTLPSPKVQKQIRSSRLTEQFIPRIPLWWAIAAAKAGRSRRLTGTTIVGQVLWQHQAMRKSATVRLSTVVWRKIGLDRRLVKRALSALEDAGLIKVQRFKHRSPAITILGDKAPSVDSMRGSGGSEETGLDESICGGVRDQT